MDSWEMSAEVEIHVEWDQVEHLRDKTLEVVSFDSPATQIAGVPVHAHVQRGAVSPHGSGDLWRVGVTLAFVCDEAQATRVAVAVDGYPLSYHGGEATLRADSSWPERVTRGEI